ncbi:hypothetical protein ACG83_30720 [Frankia sp. R43]|nr:hypothetical protein ACG83_30720 [Frankia sp. R43]
MGHLLELMDEPAGLALGILSALVAVGAEVPVDARVVEQVPGDQDHGVGDRGGARLLTRRSAIWR